VNIKFLSFSVTNLNEKIKGDKKITK